MTIYVCFNNKQPAFYDDIIHKPEQIPETAKAISKEVYQEFLNNQGTKILDESTLKLKSIPKDFNMELKNILNEIKFSHLTYMKEVKLIDNFYFPVDDDSMQQLRVTINDCKSAGMNIIFTRDCYNNYVCLNLSQIEEIYTKLSIMKQISFLKKWQLEIPFKKCSKILELEALPKEFNINISEKEVEDIYNMSPEQKALYMQSVSKIFIN